MNVDSFMLSLGIVNIESVGKDAAEMLCNEAENFLRAHGQLRLSDWAKLSEVSKLAFVKAAGMLDREQAAFIGIASQSPMGALAVQDEEAALDKAAEVANQKFSEQLSAKVSE